MTEASPNYPGVTMSYESQVSEFHRLIAAKQAEVNELGDRLQLLSVPPIDAIAPGQLTPAERVEHVLKHQASEAERMKSVEAIRVVLDQARSELDSLKTSLSQLENKHEADLALAELDAAIHAYNASASEFHNRREALCAVTRKNAPVLKRVGLDPVILGRDPLASPEFAINGPNNGRFYWRRHHQLSLEEKLRIAVDG